MRDVHILGVGQTPVGEHWDKSLRCLAVDASLAAMRDARLDRVQSVFVGNMLAGALGQRHIGAVVADGIGLKGVEAFRVEAACASGGAAVRAGYAAVASGLADIALVVGVEKQTDFAGAEATSALATAADADFEAQMGLSFVAINALMMRRYMSEYKIASDAFAPFIINAHENARTNPNAMLRFPVSKEDVLRAKPIAEPIGLMDCSPSADGAAAVVLGSADAARSGSRVRLRACTVACDSVAVHDWRDPLALDAAALSAARAYETAGIGPRDVDLFEAHDAFSIMTVLSLEACGFAERGRGVELGANGDIVRHGKLPICTMGGLKARGHPVGASGVYQVVELALQLRGQAGANQVKRARFGMAQSIGGSCATAITTILEACT